MFSCYIFILLFYILQVISDEDVSVSTYTAAAESTRSSLIPQPRSSSPSPPASCTCENDVVNSSLVENAKRMQEQVQNKTMINNIRHRATHSNDAMWASICLSSLLVLVMVSLLQSKMWTDTTFLSYPESQPVKYEPHNNEAEVKVKHLLKSQARKLKKYFSKTSRRKGSADLKNFKMETFMHNSDEVDSIYKKLMESSSSESDTAEDSEEDEVFSINRMTGEWEAGARSGLRTRPSGDGLGGYQIVNTSITRDLTRVSESSGEARAESESEPLISI